MKSKETSFPSGNLNSVRWLHGVYRLIRVAALYESLCTSPSSPSRDRKNLTKQRREIISVRSLAVTLSSHCRYFRVHFAARFRTLRQKRRGDRPAPVHIIGIVGFSCVLLVPCFVAPVSVVPTSRVQEADGIPTSRLG